MLYVGVTNNMHRRIFEHKNKLAPGFSKKYNLHRLIYFEAFGHIGDAIAREKQIKGWLRAKKIALIEAQNPKWQDLAARWFEVPKSEKETNVPPSKRVSS
jgi:putative endonuclease